MTLSCPIAAPTWGCYYTVALRWQVTVNLATVCTNSGAALLVRLHCHTGQKCRTVAARAIPGSWLIRDKERNQTYIQTKFMNINLFADYIQSVYERVSRILNQELPSELWKKKRTEGYNWIILTYLQFHLVISLRMHDLIGILIYRQYYACICDARRLITLTSGSSPDFFPPLAPTLGA